MKGSVVVTLIIVILLFWLVNALPDKLEERNFVTCEFPPRAFMKDGRQAGIDVEIVHEVCNRLGIRAVIRILPWKRAQMYVRKGKADAIFSLKLNEERKKFLYFTSETTYADKILVIVRKGSGIKATGLDELKGKLFGVVRKYSYGEKFDNCQGLKKIVCNIDSQMLRMLDRGRLDVAVGEEENLKSVSRSLGFEDRFETLFVVDETRYHIGVSKKALGEKGKSLAEKLSRTLGRLKEEGIIRKIESKY
ncbi:transporter substrate-binding domain-containing protein [Desulfobacterales bacterium HSG2]|nr:transporter substrate-binding domain-containing protein [Desulfobacterales bacterium HSG2]